MDSQQLEKRYCYVGIGSQNSFVRAAAVGFAGNGASCLADALQISPNLASLNQQAVQSKIIVRDIIFEDGASMFEL